MNLKDILAVSGLPGLYKLVSNRNNGLVVQDLDGGKSIFCSLRKHQFTPMETVAIYTYEDSMEMSKIFDNIREIGDVVNPNASGAEISKYFRSIVPDYDEERVYVSDMKKVLKWYTILDEKGYLDMEAPASEEEE